MILGFAGLEGSNSVMYCLVPSLSSSFRVVEVSTDWGFAVGMEKDNFFMAKWTNKNNFLFSQRHHASHKLVTYSIQF